MPTYKQFANIRHPEHKAALWEQCRAFYAGGQALLGNKNLMRRVFPPHLAEEDFVYQERLARAYYIPYAGEIVDAIVAALFGEPVSVKSEPEGVDPFYDDFFEDVSPPLGRKMSLNELMKQQVLTALLCQRAWTLVDLPDIPPDLEGGGPESLAEEEALGLRSAYAVPIDPEMVLDWEESEDGELLWALVLHREQRRRDIESDRSVVREEYTLYTTTDWTRYAIEYKVDKPPPEKTEVEILDEGTHSFGRVPLLRFELTDGLWAMGKILDIAVAHFNKRNALSWAEFKSLFPVPVAYLDEESALNPATEDPDRATNQRYGQGRIVVFGAKDKFEYAGPDSAPFSIALEDLAGLRDEMHRVLHHMALSVDNSAAALQRSAESKQIDQTATAVILRALGQYVRDHVVEIYEMVQTGRDDAPAEWSASGMEKFNEQSVDALVTQAETIDTLSIPSAKFKQLWCYNLARRILGDNATQEDLDQIRDDLEANVANEDYLPPIEMTEPPDPMGDEYYDEVDQDDDDGPPANGGRMPRPRGARSQPKANPL